MLTARSIWVKGGRRRGLDGEGRSSGGGNGGRQSGGPIPARFGRGRVRGGTEELRGEVARRWAREDEVGRRGVVGAELGSGSSSCSARRQLDSSWKKERQGMDKGDVASGRDRDASARLLGERGSTPADAWSRRPSVAGWARVRAQ